MPFTKGVSGNSRGRWKKGQSGNPGGRPRGLRILLRERYGDDAKALVDVLHDLAFNSTNLDPEKRYRLVADLLDRHSGRPAQAVSVGGPDGKPLASKLHVEIYPSYLPDQINAPEPKTLTNNTLRNESGLVSAWAEGTRASTSHASNPFRM